jgi:hypothetical protein
VKVVESEGGIFLWEKDADPAAHESFRVPGPHPDSEREPEDLPIEEVASCAAFVLRNQVSLPVSDLVKVMGKRFGYSRAGRVVKERMMLGIRLAVERGRARMEGDLVMEGEGRRG